MAIRYRVRINVVSGEPLEIDWTALWRFCNENDASLPVVFTMVTMSYSSESFQNRRWIEVIMEGHHFDRWIAENLLQEDTEGLRY